MLFTNIDLLDEQFQCRRDQFVGVRGDRIAYIGDVRPEGDWGDVCDGRHSLLMSGMVNAHSHAPMVLLRGYGENLPLDRWLNEKVFPFEAHLDDPAVYAATTLACAEMLRFGTTSFSDMYFFCQTMARAVLESGMKCNLSRGLTVFDDTPYRKTAAYRDNCDLLKNYHGAGDGRLLVDLCIHGEYTTRPETVVGVAEHAGQAGVRVHVHLSETRKEHEECRARHGMTPTAYFESLGLFEQPTLAAHCVWLDDADFDILARRGVTVACNPVSNMKLASGFARAPLMLEKGINVALGTDGCASNNNLNLMQDLYLFALLYKGVSGDPTVITPAQALAAATVNGFRAQGRSDCGVIRVGAKADLIVLNTDVPHMHPMTDPVCNLVYAAQGADVQLTMVDGRVLYQNGEYKTIDVERAIYETERAAQGIVSRLAKQGGKES